MIQDIEEVVCPEEYITETVGVEYRNVEHILYPSRTVGCKRGANVALPIGYTTEKKYPVLYILHGIFGNEDTMLYAEDGKIPEILGNMALSGAAREVIAVFVNMYATADPALAPGFSVESLRPYDEFIHDLVNDLIPYIEANYSCRTDRMNRGILGFSMGAKEALYIGLRRSDLFGYIAAAAPAPGLVPGKDWAMEHPGMYTEEEVRVDHGDCPPEVLLMCCGSKDSVVGKFPIRYHELFERNGVEHIWYEASDVEHNERIVQSAIYNLMLLWQ